MVAASLTKAGIAAPVVAQASARAPRVAAFSGFKPFRGANLGKSADASLTASVSARVANVQVR